MSGFKMFCEGLDGTCPVCHKNGLLLRQEAVYGGTRTLVHLDEQGQEQTCTLDETAGVVRTSGAGWWYEPATTVWVSKEGLDAALARVAEVEAERDLLARQLQAVIDLAHIAESDGHNIRPDEIYRIVTTDPGDNA